MSHRPLVALLVGLTLAVAAIGEEGPGAESKRGAYVVKYAASKDLAAILSKHFKGAADIQAGPEGTTHTLLVRASPAIFDEVMKLLDLLDRKPHSVAVEVFLLEVPARKGTDKETGINEKDLSGPLADVVKNLDALRKKGQLASVKRIQIAAQEGHLASLSVGENKPYTVGENVTARGLRQATVMYRSLGTIVQVTPQVAADRSVTLALKVEDSRMSTPEDGGQASSLRAPAFPVMTLTSKVTVRSGQAVLVKDSSTTEKGAAQMLVVVSARVAE
jgi:type II secretory pathway component GspD/PulD (secretin)